MHPLWHYSSVCLVQLNFSHFQRLDLNKPYRIPMGLQARPCTNANWCASLVQLIIPPNKSIPTSQLAGGFNHPEHSRLGSSSPIGLQLRTVWNHQVISPTPLPSALVATACDAPVACVVHRVLDGVVGNPWHLQAGPIHPLLLKHCNGLIPILSENRVSQNLMVDHNFQ